MTREFPANLTPTVFTCKNCGCTVRYLSTTNSYVIMSVHKDVEMGKIPACSYCTQLIQYAGITK